jgi:signal transduction histidine kinase
VKRIQPDLRISALQGEVKQIVSNLVANAIDASLQDCSVHLRVWQAHPPVTGIAGIRLVVVKRWAET